MNDKETLEEVAKKIYRGEYVCNGIDIVPAWREGFILGAKWQQEQDNNKFSEEEVLEILYKHTEDLLAGKKVTLEEGFEQFKNK